MAQKHLERWARKILSFPVFTDAFAQAIAQSPFGNLALVASMEVGAPAEFVSKVAEWATTLEPEVAEELLRDPIQC